MTLRLEQLSLPALQENLPAWRSLARTATMPNPFLEPWALIPALKWLGDERIRLLVARSDEGFDALVPVCQTQGPGGLPSLMVWRHIYSLVGAPLVRAGRVAEVLDALRAYARDTLGPHGLLSLEYLPEPSEVGRVALRSGAYPRKRWERPLWLPDARPNAGSKRRKTLRRLGRRLREAGHVTWERIREPHRADRLLNAFLRLESRGWKGRNGTAVAQNPADHAFFRNLVRGAASEAHLDGHMLLVDGVPIAVNIDLVSNRRGFSVKTAYDEDWHQFSPGLQLEQHVLEVHQREGELRWLDSCASSRTPGLDAIWPARRSACDLLVPTGRISRLVVSALPWWRRLRQNLRTKRAALSRRRGRWG